MKIVDGVFDYRDQSFGRDSTCRMRVYEITSSINVVIVTELKENQGPSVTNSAEAWATEACKEYDLSPVKTIFIEHYDHGAETYDLIEFDWSAGRASRPRWRPMDKRSVETIIGEPV